MDRRLSAILAADIVGYSRLMSVDEAGALAAIRRLRAEVVEPRVAAARGVVVKRMGDGWLAEFASVVDAVGCALEIQTAMTEEAVDLRVGVHAGDVVHEDGDIYGDAVNVASRLEALGAPGHVLLSGEALRQVGGAVDARFHDNGAFRVKNISEPLRVWSWPSALPAVRRGGARAAKPTVCVAAFEARGDEAEELAGAIRDDIATALARQTGLVLSTAPERADYVLSGAVRGRGARWRVTASLTEQDSRQNVWSTRYDETGEDLLDVEDRCGARIAGAVRLRMPALLAERAEGRPLDEMDVEDLLNFAMNGNFTPTAQSWNRSREALAMALERDPQNWMAMTMLSWNRLSSFRLFGWRRLDAGAAADAMALVERARALKPQTDVARMVHGALLLLQFRDHRSARIEIEEALRINPKFYHSLNIMALIELFDGDLERADALAHETLDCDPSYPFLHIYQRDAGCVAAVAGQHDRAADLYERANRAAPGLPCGLIGLAISRQLAGDGPGARDAVGALMNAAPGFNLKQAARWPFRDPSRWSPFREALARAGAPAGE